MSQRNYAKDIHREIHPAPIYPSLKFEFSKIRLWFKLEKKIRFDDFDIGIYLVFKDPPSLKPHS